MGFALSQAFVMTGMFAYIAGSPFVLQNIYGVSAQMFSLLFAVNGAGIICATQITGRMAKTHDERKLFVSGLLIAVIGSIALLLSLAFGFRRRSAFLYSSLFLLSGSSRRRGFLWLCRNRRKAREALRLFSDSCPLSGCGCRPCRYCRRRKCLDGCQHFRF